MVTCHILYVQVYSVRVRVNTDHVLGLLLEKEQFNIARKYAELVNSTSSQITIKEVCIVQCDAITSPAPAKDRILAALHYRI